jgi:predicted site-specific integrase-resolvase
VFNFLNRENERKNVIYGRVSTSKQKVDLENQIDDLKKFCISSSIIVHDIYKDIGSGINFDRKEFNRLLNDVVSGEISTVYVTYKDRLSRISFNMFKNLFAKFGTNIVVINEIDDTQTLEAEIVKEIIDLIHCFSMKVYSKRRKKNLKKIEEIIKNVKEHD